MKVDLFREHRSEYTAREEPSLVTIPAARYLSISGRGAPGSEPFVHAIQAMYGMAYSIKMADKSRDLDFKVGALEGLWWTPEGGADYRGVPPAEWRWKLLIRVPDFVHEADLAAARESLASKHRLGVAEEVHLEIIEEGQCVQALHVGAYADEPRTIAAMDALIARRGLHHRGPHHEIYLSDPGRVPPERLRTILRMPVAP